MSGQFVDFAEVKEAVPIEQVLSMLDLVNLRKDGKQWRAACPACKSGGNRIIVITPAKNLFYCFKERVGGDQIALVSHVLGIPPREAAQRIAEHFQVGNNTSTSTSSRNSSRNSSDQPRKVRSAALQPLAYLEADHEVVQALGVSPATAEAFGSGYAPKGVLRGRYAVPIHEIDGTLVAYVGIAVTPDHSPRLQFHNFVPETVIWNAERIAEGGDLFVCGDPLQVILAVENGIPIENLVAFLTEAISAQQLEMLASLMDTKNIEHAELY